MGFVSGRDQIALIARIPYQNGIHVELDAAGSTKRYDYNLLHTCFGICSVPCTGPRWADSQDTSGPEDSLMQFAERFIRRPVLSSMISLGIVLLGVIAYRGLPVREFPDADPPIVSVTVILPGASPQVVESAVTDVLEEELSSVEGLRSIRSASW